MPKDFPPRSTVQGYFYRWRDDDGAHPPGRKAMLEPGHPEISVRRQCVLLSLPCSGVYRAKRPANDAADPAPMRRLDALFTWPFPGSRRLTAMPRADGLAVDRKRVRRLMRLMRIVALGPKPKTTRPAPGHAPSPAG